MEAPSDAPVARRQPRRRVPPFVWLAAALVAVLAGRGLGLFGRGGTPPADPGSLAASSATANPPRSPVATAPVANPPAAPAAEPAAAPAAPAASPDATPSPPPAGSTQPAPALPAAAAPVAAQTVDADRFGSLLGLLEARIAERQFQSAHTLGAQLLALPLDGAQRAAAAAAVAGLDAAVGAAGREVAAALARGEVLAVRQQARAPGGDPAALLAALAAAGVSAPETAPRRDGPPASGWPQQRPLARDRAVRALLGGVLLAGRVVDSRADSVTLRVPGPDGVTWPTLPAAACEPVDPTAAEAVEMAWTALHAGDPLLARLWLACAFGRAGDRTAGRVRALLEALH